MGRIIIGDDIDKMMKRTFETKLTCRKCGKAFTFEEGASLGKKSGIMDKVVMCPKCHSVYDVDVTFRGITLLGDATDRYAHLR